MNTVIVGQADRRRASAPAPRAAVLHGRPSLKWIPQGITEWVWWPLFAFWSFIPSSKVPVIRFAGIYIALSDFLLAAFAIATLPFALVAARKCPRLLWWAYIPFTVLILYAIVSAFLIHDYRHFNFPYVVAPAILAWASMSAGFAVVVSTIPRPLDGLAFRLAVGVLVVGFLYSLVTTLTPFGFRAGLGVDPTFGVVRLGGPLGATTILPILFITSISYLVAGVQRIKESFAPVAAAGLLVGATFLTGSRAAILTLGLLSLLILLRGTSFRAKAGLLSAILLAAAFVFQYALPERLLNFEENERLTTYERALRAWTETPLTLVMGRGYGDLWPWYLHDVHIYLGESRWYQFYNQTPYGLVLSHAHSTFLAVLVEMGLIGLVLLCLVLGVQLIPALFSSGKGGTAWLLAPGIAASLMAFAFDTVLFKAFTCSAVWWTLFFAMGGDYSSQLQRDSTDSRKHNPPESGSKHDHGARTRDGDFNPQSRGFHLERS